MDHRVIPPVPPLLTALAAAALLAGCGGGGGDGEAAPPPPAPQPAVIAGTAAIGAALVGGDVEVRDRSGAAACDAGSELTTNASGAYRCVLKAGVQAPLALAVTDPAGLVDAMVSLAASTPGAGATATVNITRLTTAIAAQLAPQGDPFAFVKEPAQLASLDAAALAAVRRNVTTQLAPVLTGLGVDAATFDPVATPFVGGSSTGADALLDQVMVRFENGAPVLANLLAPEAAPVPMAGATGTPQPVPATTVRDAFSVAEFDALRDAFEACFELPPAQRAAAAPCSRLVVDHAPANLTGNARYLNGGIGATVFLDALFTRADLEGARFNAPELMRFIAQGDGRHEAVVNLKFADRNGVPENRILVLKKFPGTASAARASDWWIHGNQRRVNIGVRAALRQQEQMIPPAAQATYPASPSRFQTGLEFFIARPCADTLRQCPNTEGLRYVRVKGPGLPTAGLVYADVGNLPQSWMAILNTDGTIPAGPQQTTQSSNNILWLQRSRDIVGDGALQVRPNPGVAQAAPISTQWAHPSMYGEASSAEWRFDLGKVPAWSEYRFEYFRGEQVTTDEVYMARMPTSLVNAASGAGQQWHAYTEATKAQAAPGAPATRTLDLAWTDNPYAQRPDSVQVYSGGPDGVVNSASMLVAKGASSQTVQAFGERPFAALSLQTPNQFRFLQLRYRMLDGTYKDMGVSFN